MLSNLCSQIQLDKTKPAASLSLCLPLVRLYLLHGKLVCCKESPGSVKVTYSLFLVLRVTINVINITGIFNAPISYDWHTRNVCFFLCIHTYIDSHAQKNISKFGLFTIKPCSPCFTGHLRNRDFSFSDKQ